MAKWAPAVCCTESPLFGSAISRIVSECCLKLSDRRRASLLQIGTYRSERPTTPRSRHCLVRRLNRAIVLHNGNSRDGWIESTHWSSALSVMPAHAEFKDNFPSRDDRILCSHNAGVCVSE